MHLGCPFLDVNRLLFTMVSTSLTMVTNSFQLKSFLRWLISRKHVAFGVSMQYVSRRDILVLLGFLATRVEIFCLIQRFNDYLMGSAMVLL